MNALTQFWALVGNVLRLDTSVIEQYVGAPGSAELAIAVVMVAGGSEARGKSVVLFINRVMPLRFILTLIVFSVIFLFSYFFLTLSVYWVARLAFSTTVPYSAVAVVIAFSFAPRVLGFLEFLPVFGRPLGALLKVWSLL